MLYLLKSVLILSLPSKGLGFNISVYICNSEFRTSRRKHLVCYRQKLPTSCCVPCTVKNVYSVCIHAHLICFYWTEQNKFPWKLSSNPSDSPGPRMNFGLRQIQVKSGNPSAPQKAGSSTQACVISWDSHMASTGLKSACKTYLAWEAGGLGQGAQVSRPCKELEQTCQDLTGKLSSTFLEVSNYYVHILLTSRTNKP